MNENTTPWTAHWLERPLLAFVEQREDVEAGDVLLVLDVVRRDAIDNIGDGGRARAELEFAATAQVVVNVPRAQAGNLEGWTEGTWQAVLLAEEGVEGDLYRTPSGAQSSPARLSFGRIEPELSARMAGIVSLDDIPDIAEHQIAALLRWLNRHAHHVAVINVGQGNSNAVCEQGGWPILYFDLGAGCLQNAPTRPADLEFCFCCPFMPVVLSHWHFDHWYGAELERNVRARWTSWIAPRQPIGVRTLQFARKVWREGGLRLWPNGAKRVRVGKLELLKCTGSSKNDSGIALAVLARRGAVLCPGDAAFPCIPRAQVLGQRTLAGLVVPHHGAATLGHPAPRPKGKGARAAFSFGVGNSFGHPKAEARSALREAGWRWQLDTPAGTIALGGKPLHDAWGVNPCPIRAAQPWA